MKEVKIGENTYTLKKIGYLDGIEIEELKGKGVTRELAEKLLLSGTTITKEQIEGLSIKEGADLQRAINEFNQLGESKDFQEPTESKQN